MPDKEAARALQGVLYPGDERPAAEILAIGWPVWYPHFDESVTVSGAEFVAWAENEGIAAHDEVDALLDALKNARWWQRAHIGFPAEIPPTLLEKSPALEKREADKVTKPKKTFAKTWWRTDYDIMALAQSAGDSLRRKGDTTSNRSIGDAVAKEIEDRERAGKKRKGPDGATIKNTDLNGWRYEAE